jgi:hypothetical protein
LSLPNVAIDARERAPVARREPKSVVAAGSAHPNRLSRFVQKFGFGERR